MAIHIGKKIREELYSQGLSVTDFAKKINRSRNVAYDIFDRESIDTALLNKIAKVLNVDFFSLYSSQKEFSLDSVKNYSGEPPANYGKNAEEILLLQQQNEALLKEVVYLKKIINLLESPKPKVKRGK